MDFLKLLATAIVVFAIGAGLGYYYAPDKIKVQEKIVEKEVVKKEEYKKKTKKYDKDGKLVEESEETGNKQTNSNTSKNESSSEKEKTRKMWALKGGIAFNPRDMSANLIPRIGAEVRLPIFDSWFGVEADFNINRPLIGTYVKVEF